MSIRRTPVQTGFSLVEMAVVLAIIGLLLGGMLLPLSAQIELQNANETQRRLDMAREALLGFAMTNRRLPCPASTTSQGLEVPLGGGTCSTPLNGYIPAVTLGLLPVNSSQMFVDAWGNPIRYAVTNFSLSNPPKTYVTATPLLPFTTSDGIRTVYNGETVSGLAALLPNLSVCSAATCTAANTLTSNAVAVLFSTGKNTATGGIGTDEAANLNGDSVFVSHTPTPSTASGGEFDDIVQWLSPYLLYNRMIVGGALP